MSRQALTGYTVLVKSRETNSAVVAGGRRGKDDRKLTALAPILPYFRLENQLEIQVQMVAVQIQLKPALICNFDHSKTD
jgi:hypothetical protein